MKKHLLSTSAIALGVAMASPAAAQQWDIELGGYYNAYFGATDFSGSAFNTGNPLSGTDYQELGLHNDAEIDVMPSITLDNGLTFGATIQFETGQSSRYTDEVYISVSGDQLGRIDIGSENSAGYKMMVAAPNPGGIPINSGSVSGFVPFATSGTGTAAPAGAPIRIVNSFVGAGISAYNEVGRNSDVQRITYYTPSFNGLTVGVSYAPDGAGTDGGNALSDTNTVLSDIFDLGVSYSQSFGEVDVNLGARWGTADTPIAGADDPEAWGLGAQVGFGAFTFGGSYSENDNGLAGGALDEEGYTLGMTYDLAGPWSAGIEYFHGEGSHGSGNGKDEVDFVKIAASRNMGPGVAWDIALNYTEIDAADASTGGLMNGSNGTDIEATTLSTAIRLSF